jgi:hypothetical protein
MISTASNTGCPFSPAAKRQNELRHVEFAFETVSNEAQRGADAAQRILTKTLARQIAGNGVPPLYTTSDDLLHAMHHHHTTLEDVLRTISLGRQQIVESGRKMCELLRQKRMIEFKQHYDPTLGACPKTPRMIIRDKENSSEMDADVCCTLNGRSDLSESEELTIYNMRCCNAEICEGCLLQHSFQNVLGLVAKCPFCNAPYNVFKQHHGS